MQVEAWGIEGALVIMFLGTIGAIAFFLLIMIIVSLVLIALGAKPENTFLSLFIPEEKF